MRQEVRGRGCEGISPDDVDVLQIDHIKDNGAAERRAIKGKFGNAVFETNIYYARVIKGNTTDYQLLCANCNWRKRVKR